jgi:beta-lactamase class A
MALEAMIHQSDNAASDLIAHRVGIDRINQTLKDEGLTGFGPLTSLLDVRRLAYGFMSPRVVVLSPQEIRSIGIAKTLEGRVERLLELVGEPSGSLGPGDWDRAFRDYYRLGYNTASMESMGAMLERLANRTLVNAEASKQMIEILLGTQTGTQRMVAKIPVGVDVAHKTGTQYLRICDLGIIYVEPDHPVIFSACTKGGSRSRAEEVIAMVAKKTYELLAPESIMDPVYDTTSSTAAEFANEGGADVSRPGDPKSHDKRRPVKRPVRRGHP